MESNKYYVLTHFHPLIYRSQKTSWFCDLSVQVSGCMSGQSPKNKSTEDRYVCSLPNCFFAACLKCYEHYKCSSHEIPDEKSALFSRIHPHQLTYNVGKSWTCDGKKVYTHNSHADGENKPRYSCRKCDFDLCANCFFCSFDPRNHISKAHLLRASKEKKAAPMASHTLQQLEEKTQDESMDELRQKVKALEIENQTLKQELANIKALIFEVQEELTEFRNELTGELKDILMNYAGSAFGVFDMIEGAVSSIGDVLTLIPGIGQIASAVKMVYNACSSPVKAIKNKVKADKIKKTLDKLENLKAKLISIA